MGSAWGGRGEGVARTGEGVGRAYGGRSEDGEGVGRV